MIKFKRLTLLFIFVFMLSALLCACSYGAAEPSPPIDPSETATATPASDMPSELSSPEPVVLSEMFVISKAGGVYKIAGSHTLYIFAGADMIGTDGERVYVLKNGALYEAYPNERIIAKGLNKYKGYTDQNFYVYEDFAFFAVSCDDGFYDIVALSLTDGTKTELPLSVVDPDAVSVVDGKVNTVPISEEGWVESDSFDIATYISTNSSFPDIAATGEDYSFFWEGAAFYYFNGAAGQVLIAEAGSEEGAWYQFGDIDLGSIVGVHDSVVYYYADGAVSSFDLHSGDTFMYARYESKVTGASFSDDGFFVCCEDADGTFSLYVCQYGVQSTKKVDLPFGGAIWTGLVNEDSELPEVEGEPGDLSSAFDDIEAEVPEMVG